MQTKYLKCGNSRCEYIAEENEFYTGRCPLCGYEAQREIGSTNGWHEEYDK